MTIYKLFFIFILLAVVTALFYFNKINTPVTPIVKRTSLENITLLQLPRREDESFMEALIRGTLVVESGCLKLDVSDSHTVYTLVFPTLFHIQIENDALVIKHHRRVVGQEGRMLEISGGEASDITHLNPINYQQCNQSPFWIAGAEMRFLN